MQKTGIADVGVNLVVFVKRKWFLGIDHMNIGG